MKQYLKTMFVMIIFVPCLSHAKNLDGWYLKSQLGLSALGDSSAQFNGLDALDGRAEVSTDSGFFAGVGVGRKLTQNWALELAWEYRSNDSSVLLSDASGFEEGDYASNTFFLNGVYSFDTNSSWQPYVGAGLAWLQEIDIDLEANGQELSYSANGDIGLNVFAGVSYAFSEKWSVQAELRAQRISGLELEPEGSAQGKVTDLDYKPNSLQISARYTF